jgi:hypothetical protein
MKRSVFLFAVFGLIGLSGIAACSSRPSEDSESLSQAGSDLDGGAEGGAVWTADNCLDGQNMDALDVDISRCPALPQYPRPASLPSGEQVSLGAWEIGTTSNGETYKYGGLSPADGGPGMVITFEGGSAPVNDGNLKCWAKGYYRLRKILQDPPSEWMLLRGWGFQFRFFQFQTDMRNGATGYRKISSFQNHLVKWVTVISQTGECQQPTLTKFRDYAKSELTRRGIDPDGGLPVPEAGAPDASSSPSDAGAATDAQ